MKISGIICEYNPLHNGHLYHLEQVRRGGAEGIVAVMSGNFVQRGDAALLDKFTRARLAIEGGVDLVLELPVPYALAPAENFAMGGVALLTALGNVQKISFGSECGDIHLLSQAAQACQVCKTDYADVMDDFLRSGYSYPEVLSQMVGQLYGEETAAVLRSPNNTLAIAYLNAIEEMDSPLQPMTIPRRGAGHNSSQPAPDGTASATYIRQFFAEGGDCRRMMPSYAWHALREAKQNGHIASMEYLERLILYKLRTTDADDLHGIARSDRDWSTVCTRQSVPLRWKNCYRRSAPNAIPWHGCGGSCCTFCWTSARQTSRIIRHTVGFWRSTTPDGRSCGIPRTSGCCPFPTRWQNWLTPVRRQDAVRHWNHRQPTSTSWHGRSSDRENPISGERSSPPAVLTTRRRKNKAIPHKERLVTLHAICLQISRHISQKCS